MALARDKVRLHIYPDPFALMRYDSRILRVIVCLVVSAVAAGRAHAQAPTRDQQMMEEAQALNDQGKYAEAAAKYEEMSAAFPKAPGVPEALFRAGYAHYLAANYDAATVAFKKVIDLPRLAPELAAVKEVSMRLIPQVQFAKASKLEANDPARRVGLEDTVKHLESYLGAYPKAEDVESTNHHMAMVLSQLERFDEAEKVLRENVKKFAASPTMQDSQYSLALTLAAMAGKEMAKPNPDVAAAEAQFDEGESLLPDIIQKNLDFARANDAQFQLGELLSTRARYLRGDADQQKREAYRARALDAYQAVAGKDRVVAAQKERIKSFKEQMLEAGASRDLAGFQKFKHLMEKATERLAVIESQPDQAPVAKSRIEGLAP